MGVRAGGRLLVVAGEVPLLRGGPFESLRANGIANGA